MPIKSARPTTFVCLYFFIRLWEEIRRTGNTHKKPDKKTIRDLGVIFLEFFSSGIIFLLRKSVENFNIIIIIITIHKDMLMSR